MQPSARCAIVCRGYVTFPVTAIHTLARCHSHACLTDSTAVGTACRASHTYRHVASHTYRHVTDFADAPPRVRPATAISSVAIKWAAHGQTPSGAQLQRGDMDPDDVGTTHRTARQLSTSRSGKPDLPASRPHTAICFCHHVCQRHCTRAQQQLEHSRITAWVPGGSRPLQQRIHHAGGQVPALAGRDSQARR